MIDMEKNIVIGIEGHVGAGKTSICKYLLDKIPNSIILHGGNIYRAIVYAIMQSGIKLQDLNKKMNDMDVMELFQKFNIDVKIEDRESVIYINGKKINPEELQSNNTSMAVSIVANIADNTKLYEYGKKLIEHFKEEHNVILSSRDIMKMYPDTDYHFFITASLEERVNRKYLQYDANIKKEEIQKTIVKRDKLQEDSGYYNLYPNTIVIDTTDSKSIKDAAGKLLNNIKILLTQNV